MIIIQNGMKPSNGWLKKWELCFNITKPDRSGTYYNADYKRTSSGYRGWVVEIKAHCFKYEVQYVCYCSEW